MRKRKFLRVYVRDGFWVKATTELVFRDYISLSVHPRCVHNHPQSIRSGFMLMVCYLSRVVIRRSVICTILMILWGLKLVQVNVLSSVSDRTMIHLFLVFIGSSAVVLILLCMECHVVIPPSDSLSVGILGVILLVLIFVFFDVKVRHIELNLGFWSSLIAQLPKFSDLLRIPLNFWLRFLRDVGLQSLLTFFEKGWKLPSFLTWGFRVRKQIAVLVLVSPRRNLLVSWCTKILWRICWLFLFRTFRFGLW